jgi:ferredoxin--NADP+ reductase
MAIKKEKVLEVRHYTDNLMHFKTTRDPGTRFRDGEFLMIGLDNWSEKLQKNKPIMRAYSIASPNYEEYMEFFSIKVPDGPLTSRLQHIKPGDEILVNSKSVGTLVMPNLKPGRNLYLLATGTGVAPFMSLVRGLETYENFDNVVLVWGTRTVKELAYKEFLEGLNEHEMWGEITQGKFKFYPTVTREEFENSGRVTTAIYENKVQDKLGLAKLDKEHDRVMICGSMPMNVELKEYLEGLSFTEGNSRVQGEYVLERAFVEK